MRPRRGLVPRCCRAILVACRGAGLVLGQLPSRHAGYDYLKQTLALQAEDLVDGGADPFLIETSQDLLQTKAAVNGCNQGIVTRGVRLPIFRSR